LGHDDPPPPGLPGPIPTVCFPFIVAKIGRLETQLAPPKLTDESIGMDSAIMMRWDQERVWWKTIKFKLGQTTGLNLLKWEREAREWEREKARKWDII